ncbi:ANTAR domain-containing response regulator [Paracoccus chinensis]|uniref:Two-component response regulator, AmiR/NasT family, consists of REC and RNA-binding antiterminator (ANTAR) domains n=1 Tax=Paracoccus chinensis TaxID=525640 RepID=A0A1G9EKX1_9RHOB|nr:transcriptional antiterminator [Paracoccus chinensis]SDK76837.1 Two-component response regulator, AmiR/NasT family, consists of REC and RNA-binding antiterminator (ANTAR) domains [Paracoccus chinensis]
MSAARSPRRMDSDLRGARLLVLNRPHDSLRVLRRQAEIIGLQVTECWPALPEDAAGYDFLVLDADTGHDGQLPWGAAPMPLPSVALIGSEAPGRIDWLLSRGVHATLMQPIGDRGLYAALLMARYRFAAETELAARLQKQAWQLSQRENVLRAALLLAEDDGSSDGFAQLRRAATAGRMTIEEAALAVISQTQAPRNARGRR